MSDYKDSDGNATNIYQLINKEPEWAVSIIEKLQVENKALKEKFIKECIATTVLMEKIEALKESTDELLEALDGYFKSNSNTVEALDIINKAWLRAEALKEKEL